MRAGSGRFLRWKSLIYKGFRRIEFQNFISFLPVFLAFSQRTENSWDIRRAIEAVITRTTRNDARYGGHRPWKLNSCYTEVYRSGHNELDSKSSVPQGTVGSNPTASATKPLETLSFQGFFYSLKCSKDFELPRKCSECSNDFRWNAVKSTGNATSFKKRRNISEKVKCSKNAVKLHKEL